MIVGVAFCPAPPVLVPEVASGAAGELATLRLACDEAVARLLRTSPDEVVLVGSGTQTRVRQGGGTGSLKGYGVDLTVGDPPDRSAEGDPSRGLADPLPLSLTVGTWLLERADGGRDVSRDCVEVSGGATDHELDDLGRSLAERPARTALLVVGDGSAARNPKAPLAFDPTATGWDNAVAAALAGADAAALAGLDRARAADLAASGAGPWRVAAAAATTQGGFTAAGADLLAYEGPYGVAYFVATWLPSWLPG